MITHVLSWLSSDGLLKLKVLFGGLQTDMISISHVAIPRMSVISSSVIAIGLMMRSGLMKIALLCCSRGLSIANFILISGGGYHVSLSVSLEDTELGNRYQHSVWQVSTTEIPSTFIDIIINASPNIGIFYNAYDDSA